MYSGTKVVVGVSVMTVYEENDTIPAARESSAAADIESSVEAIG